MEKKTAIVFGGTGLTGRSLLKILEADARYEKIIVFSRTMPELTGDKVEIIKADYENIDNHKEMIKGHEVYCCLGTTMKKAGSRENFRRVDHDYPVKVAALASENRVHHFLVISSVGADPESSNFYLRTKGEMEKSVLQSGFSKIVILRPSMLLGKRGELRIAEEAGKILMVLFGFLLRGKFKKYRAIEASKVATAMVRLANRPVTDTIYESDQIESIARQMD
jgi:uncharacterized protein YbjT (DUF2867 family)